MDDLAKHKIAVDVVAEQRNSALNDCINLRIRVAELQEENAALKAAATLQQ